MKIRKVNRLILDSAEKAILQNASILIGQINQSMEDNEIDDDLPFPLKIWDMGLTRLSIKNILDIKRASALLILLFNIVWAARWRTRRAEFLFLSMLHNFGLQILCKSPSCNSPETMVYYSCQEGGPMVTAP